MMFSLIIPCFNEAANLPLLLSRCAALAVPGEIEVILVDNGSTDDSPRVLAEELARYPGCRSIRVEQNQGYGFGILQGLKAGRGRILGWTHADMQTDPVDASRGLQFFSELGDDVFVKGRRHGRPVSDVVFTLGMSMFETLLLRVPLNDINAQPTMFSRRFFESWVDAPHDFSLDLYAYYTARKSGLEICRFPVKFGDRAHGVSHWNVNWKAKWKFIRRTVDYSLRLVKGGTK
jgi:glycosyltransferase involved in cell wall biosynthesis